MAARFNNRNYKDILLCHRRADITLTEQGWVLKIHK